MRTNRKRKRNRKTKKRGGKCNCNNEPVIKKV